MMHAQTHTEHLRKIPLSPHSPEKTLKYRYVLYDGPDAAIPEEYLHVRNVFLGQPLLQRI